MAIRLLRSKTKPQTHILTIDDLLTSRITSAKLFACSDRANFFSLPHALPGDWEQAWRYLETQHTRTHHPHMYIVPYSDTSGLSIASWHSGAEYHVVITGRPHVIIRYVDMTENEREAYRVQCIKHNAAGYEILALALLESDKPITSIDELHQHRNFRHIGSIAAHRDLNARKKSHIRALHASDSRLVLISREHPDYIRSYAKKHALLPPNASYIDAHETPIHPTKEQIEAIRTASAIGHCTDASLVNYIVDTSTVLSPSAQILLY